MTGVFPSEIFWLHKKHIGKVYALLCYVAGRSILPIWFMGTKMRINGWQATMIHYDSLCHISQASSAWISKFHTQSAPLASPFILGKPMIMQNRHSGFSPMTPIRLENNHTYMLDNWINRQLYIGSASLSTQNYDICRLYLFVYSQTLSFLCGACQAKG